MTSKYEAYWNAKAAELRDLIASAASSEPADPVVISEVLIDLPSSQTTSIRPWQGECAQLAADGRQVLEGPLLADLAVVIDPVDVDGVPPDVALPLPRERL